MATRYKRKFQVMGPFYQYELTRIPASMNK